jgi:hypothetical protein
MQRADYLISRMEDMIEEPHTEEIPYQVNEKTYVEVFTHPRLFKFTRREFKKGVKWSIVVGEHALLEFLAKKEIIERHVRYKQEVTIQLTQDTVCKVSIFKGMTYVGFGKVDKEGKRIKGAGMNLDVPGFTKFCENIDNLIESMYIAPMKKLSVFTWDITPDIGRKTENIKPDIKEKQQQEQKQQEQKQKKEIEQPPPKRPRLTLNIKRNDVSAPKQTEEDVHKEEEEEEDDSCLVIDTPPSSPGSNGHLEMVIPPTPQKLEKTRARRPKLRQYRYKWLHPQGRSLYTCPIWFFHQSDCLHDASETNLGLDCEKKLHVEIRNVDRFSYEDILEKFIVEVLARTIVEEVTGNCQGCMYEAPGQVAHMEGGCLTEWEELVDQNLTYCSDVFKTEKYIHWGRCFLESMGYSIVSLEEDIKSLMEEWGEETLAQKVKDKNVGEEMITAIAKFKTT